MVEQVQPQRQWLGFLAVTDGDEGLPLYGFAVGCADIGFAVHQFAPLQKVQDRTVERRVFNDGALRYGANGEGGFSDLLCAAEPRDARLSTLQPA
jgi:hypothetical protein